MKAKKNICESCGINTNETHHHHIVPKSKGGSDSAKNLIEVCHPCHRKIHGSEFGGSSGLISHGLKKKINRNKNIDDFFVKNKDAISEFLFDFAEYHETDVLHEMMIYEVVKNEDFFDMFHGKNMGRLSQISKMVNYFYESNKDKYNLVF